MINIIYKNDKIVFAESPKKGQAHCEENRQRDRPLYQVDADHQREAAIRGAYEEGGREAVEGPERQGEEAGVLQGAWRVREAGLR